jgi:hypothetical protein
MLVWLAFGICSIDIEPHQVFFLPQVARHHHETKLYEGGRQKLENLTDNTEV